VSVGFVDVVWPKLNIATGAGASFLSSAFWPPNRLDVGVVAAENQLE
jgi:hypothetical protein